MLEKQSTADYRYLKERLAAISIKEMAELEDSRNFTLSKFEKYFHLKIELKKISKEYRKIGKYEIADKYDEDIEFIQKNKIDLIMDKFKRIDARIKQHKEVQK